MNTNQQENKPNFNDWVKHTKFGVMWTPTDDELQFYSDHEYRKELYQEVKDQPKINFEERPFLEVLVDSVSKLLKIKQ